MADAGTGGGAFFYKVIKFVSWLVYGVVVFGIIVLAFGFVLLLFGAKPTGFAETIYTFGSKFMNPFTGMIAPSKLGNGGAISWNALFAIAAYAVLAWIMSSIVDWASRRAFQARQPAPATAAVTAQPPAAAAAAPPAPAATAAPTPAATTQPVAPTAPPSAAESAHAAEEPAESALAAEEPAGRSPAAEPPAEAAPGEPSEGSEDTA